MPDLEARFFEANGGKVFSRQGVHVATVEVGNLTTSDAEKAMKAIISALTAEFKPEAG